MAKQRRNFPSLMLVLLGVFGFSSYQLFNEWMSYHHVEAASHQVRADYVKLSDQINRRTDEPWRIIDWEGLLERNEDVVGWLHVPGTTVDYPILAGATNTTYLHLDLDQNDSFAGSIFLEENNAPYFEDLNTIIYGHNMFTDIKFSDIDAIVRGVNTDARYVYVYLPNEQVFVYQLVGAQLTDVYSSIYHLPVTHLTEFYKLMFEDNLLEVSDELLPLIKAGQSRVLTLSTCAELGAVNPSRSVVFGLLVDEVVISR